MPQVMEPHLTQPCPLERCVLLDVSKHAPSASAANCSALCRRS
jgi:hypothetical protein